MDNGTARLTLEQLGSVLQNGRECERHWYCNDQRRRGQPNVRGYECPACGQCTIEGPIEGNWVPCGEHAPDCWLTMAIAEAKREDTASPERVLDKAFCDWCDRCWREREGCAWPQECEHSAFCIKLRASVQTLHEALMKTREPEAANGN